MSATLFETSARQKTTHFFFNYLIYYAILSSFKGGRHGYSTEGTSVG